MQAPQQVVVALAQARLPHQQGLATVGPQHLLGGPAGIGRMSGLQLQQPYGLHPHLRPAGPIDRVRRLQQRNPLSARPMLATYRWTRQHRAQQAQFADAILRQQQFDQYSGWPATFGQFGIERFKTAGDPARTSSCQLGGQPERRVDDFRSANRRGGCQHEMNKRTLNAGKTNDCINIQ